MKKNNFIAVAIIVIVMVAGIFCHMKFIEGKTVHTVFYENINSIVEVKATSPVGESYGTAVIIDGSGKLVTNAHVVTYTKNGKTVAYDTVEIRFATDEEYQLVEVVKFDEELDLGLLKFMDDNYESIKAISIGDSDKLDFGDKVYAVGNSMNYGISIMQGIISNPDIIIEYEGRNREVIQSDLTISSGNSGGALLNETGALIGITSFRTKDFSGNIVYGLGYSIPVNHVMEFIDKVEE